MYSSVYLRELTPAGGSYDYVSRLTVLPLNNVLIKIVN